MQKSKMAKIVIAMLFVLILWFAAVIVRLENFRYATMIGACSCEEVRSAEVRERYECLKRQQTRTSSAWHLLYALSGSY
jgi:hypothetical protein